MLLANPFHKNRCPFCDTEFRLGDCAYISNVTPGKIVSQPQKLLYRSIHRIQTSFPKDPVYREVPVSPQCPGCKKPLPHENLSIAVVGSPGTGKSLYIAALIQQLKKLG